MQQKIPTSKMRPYISIILVLFCHMGLLAGLQAQQKSIATIKKELEQSPNPPLYVKTVLKKYFVLDTVGVMRTSGFTGLPDSLAYHGKIKKVYGPYENGKILVQILAKLPNTFNRISQIFIDTSIFTRRIADSLANDILAKIKSGSSSFEDMAVTWSMGGESLTKGDLGWIAAGALVPEIESALRKYEPGVVFKVWTRSGVHILRKNGPPKKDDGFALMMRIFL
jgi:hypothetical protein